ncbi:MAG: MBL fold metallo-hydrolase, partial [Chryseobacterium sp.]|nr:MBL fold metallo-hydrolase [Chryseobacterium sp.]
SILVSLPRFSPVRRTIPPHPPLACRCRGAGASLAAAHTPARHFSGRMFKRNNTLWSSYVLETPTKKIFVGGDSGYDFHFKEIGEKFGPFDWAILENGQYNEKWRYIHTLPEEFVKVAEELNVKNILPVHSGKFALAQHSWNEPLQKIYENSQNKSFKLFTPLIGEKLELDSDSQIFSEWWKS